MLEKKICFIGSGNMAEAIIKGLLLREIFVPQNIFCYDKNEERLNFLKKQYWVEINPNLKDMDIFVLSTKPQDAEKVINDIKQFVKSTSLIISIMAGIPIAKLGKFFGGSKQKPLQIARVMPNTPALFSVGASGYCFSEIVSQSNRDLTSILFSAVGIAVEIKEEKIDAVTALSGSGPAYVFYLAEAMIEAGINLGLDEEIANILTFQTIFGAGTMLKNSNESPKILREKVTSKGGTTEAAIKIFDKENFSKIVRNAMKNAKKKSIEMSEK